MKSILFHTLLWHGKDGPSLTGYDSRNPNVIGDQLSAMAVLAKALGAPRYGVIMLTYGPTNSPFIHTACMEMARQCTTRRIPFALCYDPWTVKDLHTQQILPSPAKENAMIAAIKHPDTEWMLGSRMYLPGRPILDFDTTVDKGAVLRVVQGIQYWQDGIDYAWIRFPSHNENAKGLPCAFPSFNDGTGADRNKQAWDQSKPARIAPPRAGAFWWDQIEAASNNPSEWIQVVYNDVRENPEGNPETLAGMLYGRIG